MGNYVPISLNIRSEEYHICITLLYLLPLSRYNNKLLHAWENRYSENRAKGLAVLQELCRNGAHIVPSESEVMNSYIEPLIMVLYQNWFWHGIIRRSSDPVKLSSLKFLCSSNSLSITVDLLFIIGGRTTRLTVMSLRLKCLLLL